MKEVIQNIHSVYVDHFEKVIKLLSFLSNLLAVRKLNHLDTFKAKALALRLQTAVRISDIRGTEVQKGD